MCVCARVRLISSVMRMVGIADNSWSMIYKILAMCYSAGRIMNQTEHEKNPDGARCWVRDGKQSGNRHVFRVIS